MALDRNLRTACFLTAPAVITAAAGADYAIDWAVVSGGGTAPQTVGPFELAGTVGQAGAGMVGDACFTAAAGFWTLTMEPSPALVRGQDGDVEVVLTDSPDPVPAGGGTTFGLRVTNRGGTEVTGLRVTVGLPADVAIVSATSAQGYPSGERPLVFDFGSLAGGACAGASVAVRVTAIEDILLTTTATVEAEEEDPEPRNNLASETTTVVDGPPRSFVWQGGRGNWVDPQKWDPVGVPGFGDTVRLPEGTHTVTLEGRTSIASLRIDAGSLDGPGELTVTAGGRAGPGGFSLDGGFNLAAGAEMEIGGGDVGFDGPVRNEGTFVWDGPGKLAFTNGRGVLLNRGLFEVRNDLSATWFGHAGRFENGVTGVFRKTGGTGSTTFPAAVPFVNQGAVEVLTGTLRFEGDVNSSGASFYAAERARTEFRSNRNQVFGAGTRFGGPGIHRVHAGKYANEDCVIDGWFQLAAGEMNGTFRLKGVMDWSAGAIGVGGGTAAVAPGGLLRLVDEPGAAVTGQALFGTLVNEAGGQILWTSAGDLILFNGTGRVENHGNLDIATNAALSRFNQGGTLHNFPGGRLTKSAGDGVTVIVSAVTTTNEGRFEVLSGDLAIDGAFTNRGTVHAAGGTSIDHRGTLDKSFEDGSVLTGEGHHRITASSAAVDGNLRASNLEFAGGFIDGTFTLDGSVEWTAGALRSGAMTVGDGSHLAISGDTAKGLWTTLVIDPGGRLTWSGGGDLVFVNGTGRIENHGRFDCATDADLVWFNGGGTFHNHPGGTFRKSGDGLTTIQTSVSVTNEGAVEVDAGTLRFEGPLDNSGGFTAATGATLHYEVIAGDPRTYFRDGTVFSGEGRHLQAGIGTALLDGTIHAGGTAFEFTSGAVSGTAIFDGDLLWTGGELKPPVDFTIPAGRTLTLSGSQGKYLSTNADGGGVLRVAGTAAWEGEGEFQMSSAPLFEVLPGGLFEIRSDAVLDSWGVPGTLFNRGTVRMVAGAAGAKTAHAFITNDGLFEILSGELSLHRPFDQSSGTTFIAGGATLASTQTVAIDGGTLTGTGTVAAHLSSGGRIRPGSPGTPFGTLSITRDFTQTGDGTLEVALGAAGASNRLDVGGRASLAGSIAPFYVDVGGGGAGPSGARFLVLTATTYAGQLAPPAGFQIDTVGPDTWLESVPPDTYGGWLNLHFDAAEQTDPERSGPGADPDRDGWDNRFEYAFGLDPRRWTPPPIAFRLIQELPGPVRRPELTFPWVRDRSDTGYLLEQSHDLQSWATVEHDLVAEAADEERTWLTLRATPALGEQRRVYLRLRVTLGPRPSG